MTRHKRQARLDLIVGLTMIAASVVAVGAMLWFTTVHDCQFFRGRNTTLTTWCRINGL